MSTAKWHGERHFLFVYAEIWAWSCQLAATASVHLHTHITTGWRPVWAELRAITMQNSCMNVSIIKFTRVANTRGSDSRPTWRQQAKTLSDCQSNLWHPMVFLLEQAVQGKTSFGAILTRATSPGHVFAHVRGPRSDLWSREQPWNLFVPEWSSIWTLTEQENQSLACPFFVSMFSSSQFVYIILCALRPCIAPGLFRELYIEL